MKKSLKWTGIVLIALIAVMMAYAVVGLNQTLNLSIESADLNGIKDGVYTGSYDCYRWTHTAKVSVKDHKIADIQLISVPSGREDLAKKLSKAIVNQQKTDVDCECQVVFDSFR